MRFGDCTFKHSSSSSFVPFHCQQQQKKRIKDHFRNHDVVKICCSLLLVEISICISIWFFKVQNVFVAIQFVRMRSSRELLLLLLLATVVVVLLAAFSASLASASSCSVTSNGIFVKKNQ